MSLLFDEQQQKPFVKKLLSWYAKNGRHDMPWRKTKDPYAIFVSEFMLQQTTVATVLPYYARFLKRFPTLDSLAKAPLNDVLALWSGLGYYARARNLWTAMRAIKQRFKGQIPSDPAVLQQLPGIGPYTAGAIAAFAFNRPAAVLDGNIIRVFMRILGIEDDPKMKVVQAVLKKTALSISDLSAQSKAGARSGKMKAGSRHVNLALMDLGATICAPKNPRCGECPVESFCAAKLHRCQDRIPLRPDKFERPVVRRLFALIGDNGRWYMGQRPKNGLFGGLWEFIGVDAPAGAEPIPFLEKAILKETGFTVRVKEGLKAFEHQLSHRTMVIRPYLCELIRSFSPKKIDFELDQYERFRWISPDNSHQFGLSSITKKILSLIRT